MPDSDTSQPPPLEPLRVKLSLLAARPAMPPAAWYADRGLLWRALLCLPLLVGLLYLPLLLRPWCPFMFSDFGAVPYLHWRWMAVAIAPAVLIFDRVVLRAPWNKAWQGVTYVLLIGLLWELLQDLLSAL